VQSPCPCSLFERGIEREKKKKKKKKASTKESKSLLLHVGAIAFANNAMPLCLFHHQPADILPPKRVFFFSMQWKSLANVHTPPNAKKKLLIWPQKSEKKLDRKKKKKKKKNTLYFVSFAHSGDANAFNKSLTVTIPTRAFPFLTNIR
jgi:hypothetical protein